ncbi:hypothetical protein HD806DRAFT_532776 [Xylariaceae sp. AK1471]|nr:hypothetical protein HD806DRAFT_532776 [Xylariaceae sp. AK1471]
MDPLSITASVLTLLGAANNVYNVLQSVRHADRGLQSLVREVNSLNGFLRSIEKALEDCRGNPYALTHIDPCLWKESKIALSDCQGTLDELGSVLGGPKKPSRSNTLFRRAMVAAELHSRAGEIASFREKISMSNLSLQTLLQVINVSLALRSNESHETILRDLKELKDALKKSSQAATVSYSALFLNEQDTRLVHHLKGLIRAADDFHASASTTASTVIGSRETQIAPTEFGEDDGRSGIQSRLPSMKRRQIETYISQNQRIVRPGSSASNSKKDEAITPGVLEGPLEGPQLVSKAREVDTNFTFSTIFTGGFSKIAQRALQQLDLRQAEGLLKEALKWYDSSGSDDTHHHRHLQIQLALCSLLQGNRQGAQDLILDLVNTSMEEDNSIPHQLLYALTLLQLHELDFQGARNNSKRLWEALQRTPHCKVLRANDAMRLLATSYQESGDSLLAEAIEAEVPGLRLFEPVPRMVDFLVDCEELLAKFFGLQGCSEESKSLSPVSKMLNLPISKQPSSLQMREQLVEDARLPMSEYPLSETDNDLSAKACPNSTKNQSKAKKRSWSNLRDFFKPRLSRETSTMDLCASNSEVQDSASDTPVDTVACHNHTRRRPSKLRKRIKTSHIAQRSSQEVASDCGASSVAGMQNPIKSKWNSLMRKSSETHRNNSLEHSSRIREWIIGQPDDKPMTITTERQDDHEGKQSLQRQFSFQMGVPDHIPSRSPATSQASCYEMPNNAVFELMDTSRPIGLSYTQAHESYSRSQDSEAMATATSLDIEYDIYDLLRYNGSTHLVAEKTIARIDGGPLPTSSELWPHLDATYSCNSSGSDSDTFSDFDQAKQSTRQTSLDSQRIQNDSDTCEGFPHQSVKPTTRQQTTGLGNNEEFPTPWTSALIAFNGSSHTMDREHLPSPLRIRSASYETTNNMAQPRHLKSSNRSRQEIALAVARLCRHRPRKTLSRRRRYVNTVTKHCRLFKKEDHTHGFDFGFNNALYSGPDAVIGPFTDLGETNSSEGQDACGPALGGIPVSSERPSDTSMPVKLDLRFMANNGEASVDEKGQPLVDID